MNRIQELLAEIADSLVDDLDCLEGVKGDQVAGVVASLELIQGQIRELQEITTGKP